MNPAAETGVATMSASFLEQLESGPRARLLALQVSRALRDSAVLVYFVEEDTAAWRVRAVVGEASVDRGAIPLQAGCLGALTEERTILRFSAQQLSRQDFAHLDIRQNFAAITYVPVLRGNTLLAAIEIVSFVAPPSDDALDLVQRLADVAAVAFASALQYEAERSAALGSVLRLTQLYDIEKIFNATLEMSDLLPVICSKVQDLLKATAVNLWMVDRDDLLLMKQAGDDPAAAEGDRQTGSETIVGNVGETGEPVLAQSEDEALIQRNSPLQEAEAVSLMAAPLLSGEELTGVLEVVSYDPDLRFGEDDLFTLTQIAGSAAQALYNSSLLQAERKIEVLRTLVSVSQEITSTLNLQRVLEAIVHEPQSVIPYERAAIALEDRNKVSVRAISGVAKLDPSSPDVQILDDLLNWVAGLGLEVYVNQIGDDVPDQRPETREKFLRYFAATGSRSFYAVPLMDDEGNLGTLVFESSVPEFLSGLHFEIIKILASQATLALRNASLYKEVPFIGVLEPLMAKKRRFLAAEKSRRALLLSSAAAVLLAFVLVPFPMRVSGQAEISPSQIQAIHAEEDGVVLKAFVREGERVAPETPLFQMVDWQQRATLASVQAKYHTATAEMNRALVNDDPTGAGQDQLEADYERGEVERAADRLSRTIVRSQVNAVVATPHVEDLVGKKLSTGDPLLELVSTESVVVDIAVSERDISLLKDGQVADVKLESLPTATFRGKVSVISPRAEALGGRRVFFARVAMPNAEGELRPGMQGAGKVRVGLRPLGYVFFRDPATWIWSTFWRWFGW